jgi:hypothetical protein
MTCWPLTRGLKLIVDSWSDESIRRRFDSEHTIISYSQDYLRQFGANGKSEALSHLGSEAAR